MGLVLFIDLEYVYSNNFCCGTIILCVKSSWRFRITQAQTLIEAQSSI